MWFSLSVVVPAVRALASLEAAAAELIALVSLESQW
jgi:hypothetical protein